MFQRKLQEALEGLEGVHVHPVADDILIVGEGDTDEEAIVSHDKRLLAFLTRCRERRIQLNAAKFQFRVTQLPYVGHVLTAEGLCPSPRKVQAVSGMPRPQDVHAVRRLIGVATYMAKFIPNLAEICTPLRALTHEGTPWRWTDAEESAFTALKAALVSAPILQYYDSRKELVLQTDASMSGLGAVLLQDEHPIAYASHAMSATECRYAQIEKEFLAILFGQEHFDQYTYGRSIRIETDHKPLETIVTKPLHLVPKRLQRMRMRLQRYPEAVIKYRKGVELHVADTLSRAYLPAEEGQDYDTVEFREEIAMIQMQDSLPLQDDTVARIRAWMDVTLKAVKELVLNGWPADKTTLPDRVRPYFKFRDELSYAEGLLFRGERVDVPEALQSEMLKKVHSSHTGVNACLPRARECLYWPGMSAQVKAQAQRCEVCRALDDKQQKELIQQPELPTLAWKRVGVDLFHLEGKEYLVLADCFSNFIEVDPLESTTSKAVVKALKIHFSRHGIPKVVVSDNGPQFASETFRLFAEKWNFTHVTSSPGYPQSNGKAESAVKAVKKLRSPIKD